MRHIVLSITETQVFFKYIEQDKIIIYPEKCASI